MIRVRCYYRYSSDEQSDGWSIEAQDKACRNFIAARSDWELDGKPYIDEAWSGKTVNRPAFQQMLQDSHDGKFDVLVCHKLDRFSRSLVDVLLTLDDLQHHNVTFASAAEPIDFTTPIGRMMLVILAFFAEWYLQNLSAETTKGMVARFDAGYWNGSLRFGYSKVEAGEEVKNDHVKILYKAAPNDDARHVLKAYEMCAAGKVDQEISDELNRAGARTYRLIENAKKKAISETDLALRRMWTKDSVGALFNREARQFYLGNTMYVGEKERKKPEHQQETQTRYGTHEPIIAQDVCDKAMAARVKRTNPGRVTTVQSLRIYLFGEGIAHCNCCGKPLRCTNSKSGEEYLYYRCASWLRGEQCDASRLQVREQLLAPQIDPYIQALELPDEWRKAVQEALLSNKETSNLEKRREDLRGQLRRLNYQFEQGLIEEADVPAYEKKAQRLIREINSITIPDTAHIVEIGEQMLSFRKVWEKADVAHRHSILKEMLEAVYVDTDTRQVVGVKPYAEFVPLFRQTKMVEENWRFVLKNDEAVQDAVITKRLHVSHGSDGVDIPSRNTDLALAEGFFILVHRPIVAVNNGE